MPSKEILALAADNRQRFLQHLNVGEAALIFGNRLKSRNGDAEFPFRQSSDILYLTAWPEEHVALFLANREEGQDIVMFVQPKDELREIWTGRRFGPNGATDVFGATEAFEYDQLSKKLPKLLEKVHTLRYRFADSPENDRLLMKSIAVARRAMRFEKGVTPHTFVDLHHSLHRQRLCKSNLELQVIRKAAELTTQAHINAMKMTRPGIFEYELDAEINHTFRKSGGTGPGYTPIVGCGENAVILHYIENNSELLEGQMVCVDAGCEYQGYTGDVTRTWPVNGKFSDAQRQLYSAVLAAQKHAIAAAVPGNTFQDVDAAAVRSLTEALISLGFLEGDLDTNIKDKTYRKWYMHGTSHWLGLDVHDVGSYSDELGSQRLLPGMILTVEPGLYVAGNDESAPQQFRGMGIRIEDDILITDTGNENLTLAAPKEIEDIETLMQEYSCG